MADISISSEGLGKQQKVLIDGTNVPYVTKVSLYMEPGNVPFISMDMYVMSGKFDVEGKLYINDIEFNGELKREFLRKCAEEYAKENR